MIKQRRRTRTRGTPRWMTDKDLDEMARRRAMMILSVLSGERSVSEVIAQEKISRQTYYQIEERGLRAMVSALLPALTESGAPTSQAQKIGELEKKVSKLEKDKRRLERLLLLTRKIVRPGRVALPVGRAPLKKPSAPRSTKRGSRPLRSSKKTTTMPTMSSSMTTMPSASANSIPKPDGEDVR
jgi:hypothetical protein